MMTKALRSQMLAVDNSPKLVSVKNYPLFSQFRKSKFKFKWNKQSFSANKADAGMSVYAKPS